MLPETRKFLEEFLPLLNVGKYKEFLDKLYDISSTATNAYKEVLNVIKGAKIDLLPHIEKIPKYYFENDLNLISFTIPGNIKVIDTFCFLNCKNLEKIVIPTSVKTIWSSAFKGCNNLKDIIYEGTQSDWIHKVKVAMYGDVFLYKVVECSDGKVICKPSPYLSAYEWRAF